MVIRVVSANRNRFALLYAVTMRNEWRQQISCFLTQNLSHKKSSNVFLFRFALSHVSGGFWFEISAEPWSTSAAQQYFSLFQNMQYYRSFTETNLMSDLWHPPSSSTPITEVASRGHLLLPADSDSGMGSWTERKCTGINQWCRCLILYYIVYQFYISKID